MSQVISRVEEENVIHGLARNCETHEKWLVLMRCCLPTFLDNQPFLMELIVMEAEKMAEGDIRKGIKASDTVRNILGELGLKLVAV
jgi:hypothetical protein